jgi:hypothetical protein
MPILRTFDCPENPKKCNAKVHENAGVEEDEAKFQRV